ncbi:hypothetical protein HOY80DRAFT_1011411 [Tuber brumale]|nr:hypothetical protein HOY80DRAFT_1011411 [Tuber brumale]
MGFLSSAVDSATEISISELENQNGCLQRMIDSLTDRIQDMQEEVQDSQTGLAEQEERTEALKTEVLKLENQKQALRMRIIELEEMEGERLESMHDLMRAILLEEKAEGLNIQVSELQEMVEAVATEKRAVDSRLLETMDQVSRLEAAEDVNSQLQDLSKMIELLRKEISILEAERAEIVATLEREIGELRVENAGLKQEITGLEQTVDHLRKDKAALQESLHLLELDMETLEEAAEVAEETKDRLEDEIEVLRDELKSQTNAMEAAQKASETFQRTISELHSQVDSLEKEKKSFLHNINALQVRLRISGEGKENLEAQICQAVEVSETDKEKLENTVEDLQNRVSEHQSALENAGSNKTRLESDIAQLTSQVTSLREAAIASNLEKEGLEREIDFLQKQVSAFEATVKLSDDQTVDLENEILSLNTQIDMFKQAEEAVKNEKEQMEINMSGMMAQIQGLTRAGKIVQEEKEDLDRTIASLNLQIGILEEERDDAQAENSRLKSEIAECKEEIATLTSMLEHSNRERESLKQNIEELEEKVVSLEVVVQDAHGGNTRLRQDIDALDAEIRTLKQASALADEEKSMIQQKIRPYIHGEQSLDMAVEEVLTELVMERNRADENERLRTELSKKIKILAQTDEGMNMGSLNPEETVERLTDRFREVRGYVEKLYSQSTQSENSPFEGHELDDFAWTGSNEDALEVLRSLVGGLYEKVNEAQARTVEVEKEKEKERRQRRLYGQYLDDIAITVGVEGEQLPAEEDVLGLVTLRLSELRQQIGSAGEKVEELQVSIQRKSDTLKSMEMDIEEAGEREAGLSRKLVDATAVHEATALQLNHAHVQIEGLNQVIQDKVTEIEDLGADLEASSEKERRLLDTIEQQASEHDITIRELEGKRREAIARLEELLEEEVLAKTRAEHMAAEQAREDSEIIRELEERAAGWKAQYDALNVRLDMMKADHGDKVAQLKDTIAENEGRINSLSKELREALETSERDISALEDQLRSARDEIANQKSALSKVSAERNQVSRELEAEILSSRGAIVGLEKKISEIENESQLQQSRDHNRLSDLKSELEAHKTKSLLEQEHSRAEIHARGEVIESHKARVSELEALLNEAEESEAVLEEGIKSCESQLQLSYEETARIKEALVAEKDKLMEELAELRIEMERTRTNLTSDIEGLRTILERKEVRINDLEAVVGILRSERVKLTETVGELEAEQIRYQDMLESERQSGLEAVQALSHQAEKYMVRFGEVKQQYIRESAKRQAEGKKASKRLREQDDEVDNDTEDMLLHAPPTPASTIPRPLSVTHSAKKRESKRRKYDSGIGVEEEEEEECTSVVPA